MGMNRRGFLAALIGAAAFDPEKLLWVPGKKLISIPKPRALNGIRIRAGESISLHYCASHRCVPMLPSIFKVTIQEDDALSSFDLLAKLDGQLVDPESPVRIYIAPSDGVISGIRFTPGQIGDGCAVSVGKCNEPERPILKRAQADAREI